MNVSFHKETNRGFTLVEAVVYIALFIIISVAVIDALFITAKTLRQARTVRAVTSGGEAAMERMIRDIRFGREITSITSVHPGALSITGYDPEIDAEQTVSYTWAATTNGGKIQVAEDGSTAQDLTPQSINVSNLVFHEIELDSTATARAVKVEMTINGVNFYGTAILRRSYE